MQHGFTLIELMVTVAILAILAAVAAPSFNEAILSNKLASYANNFVASATLARSEAIKRNAVVTLCRSANGTTCASSGGWQQGWIVLGGATVIQYQQALSADYQLTGDVYSINFQPIGAGATSATLKLCRATPSPGGQDREIKLSATGRVSVNKTSSGFCA
jgi:type IV fimbrial biogenesis protein FimT